ncbi:hypothetical protein CEXT_435451 [Caerostris extrusa]|uniref:Uncharacterized protein n=1 Tax=Caerostris extrusa TaxID=172846 RepID=A0AAV4NHQ3_CAEEX|nr:hypothetical protein CEXT_435451 [Caerostris extrusa]
MTKSLNPLFGILICFHLSSEGGKNQLIDSQNDSDIPLLIYLPSTNTSISGSCTCFPISFRPFSLTVRQLVLQTLPPSKLWFNPPEPQ